jgi:ABC-type branched-subunit amino acid transport system substrate-binding protein
MTRWLLYGVRGAPWLRRNPLEFDIPGCVNFEKLGGGGFSTVYRAYQPQFERHVAVKILDAQLGSMFRRECKTLGKLGNHPHVVTVFQADITKSGTPYIIMEYLVAGSLADRLNASGPLSWREVLTIGTRLAGVLQSVHEAGILHLDVKPANVLIGPDSEPKLADFGIARLRAALDYTTQTLCFTPCYSAPELFAGTEPTAASDLFSLGATLFALLTGHSPFLRSREEQPNIHVLLGRMLYEPTPELDPGVPEDVRAVVRRAMAVSPQDRFGSAAELGEALRTVQRNHGLTTTPLLVVPIAPAPSAPPSPPRPRRWRAATASVLLALTPVADAVHALASGATCTQANPVQADGVLSFGTVLPKTGAFVYAGPALQAGVQLAIDDVKDAGGIPGIAVQHDPANQLDEGDPSANTVRQSTDTLLAGGVDVIIGPATSASAVKVIDMVTCAGAILFSASNTSPRLSTHPDHDRYFRTAPSDIFRGPILGKLVVADGNSTVVVISRNDAFGKDLGQLTAQAIEDAGGRVLARLTYDPQATNYAREVLQIKSMDPDAIVVIGLNDSAPILRGLIAQGLGPQNKRVYGAGNAS